MNFYHNNLIPITNISLSYLVIENTFRVKKSDYCLYSKYFKYKPIIEMELNIIDYFIILYFIYFFGKRYIKASYKKMSICENHGKWQCVECEEFD